MTVAALPVRAVYVDAGDTATLYAVPCQFLSASQLRVSRWVAGVETPLSGFTVTGDGMAAPPTGKVQLTDAVAGSTIEIRRVTERTQPAVYTDREDFPADLHEKTSDREMMVIQEQDDLLTRALIVPRIDGAAPTLASLASGDGELLQIIGGMLGPLAKAQFAGMFYGGDAQGRPVPMSGTGNDAALRADLASSVSGAALVAANAHETVGDRLGAVVSVKGHGAAGTFNPSTGVGPNDSAGINLAIDACAAGDLLYFPPGAYKAAVYDGAERALKPIPIGVDVWMDNGATIYPNTADAVIDVFIPLGSNRLRVHINGRSLPTTSAVESADWINSSVGVRAYADAAHGLGASDVTIYDSIFENLANPIQADGASRWAVTNSVFRRYKQSGVLMGYYSAYNSKFNLIAGNSFDTSGDTAVAWHQVSGQSGGEAAFNVVANNRARNWGLRTAGFAFDVEETVSQDLTLQHHFLFIGNAIEHDRADLGHQLGGFTMGYVGHGLMIGNTAKGCLGSSADFAFAMLGGAHGLITGNHASDWLGGAAAFDGDDVHCIGNGFTNCGGPGGAYAIRVGLLNDTRSCSVAHNRLTITADYGHYAAGDKAIGVVAPSGKTHRDLNIDDNILTVPNDVGIGVYGTSGIPISGLSVCRNTMVAREADDPPGEFFESWGIELSYVNQATVNGNIFKDAKYAFNAANCAGVTLADNELKGSGTLIGLYSFPGSTGVRVRNTRCYQTVTTAIVAAGTATKWENDDKVVTTTRGSASGTTDGSGDLIVTHGLTGTPAEVQVTATGTTFGVAQAHTKGATTFKIRFFDAAGAALATTALTADWEARV